MVSNDVHDFWSVLVFTWNLARTDLLLYSLNIVHGTVLF